MTMEAAVTSQSALASNCNQTRSSCHLPSQTSKSSSTSTSLSTSLSKTQVRSQSFSFNCVAVASSRLSFINTESKRQSAHATITTPNSHSIQNTSRNGIRKAYQRCSALVCSLQTPGSRQGMSIFQRFRFSSS